MITLQDIMSVDAEALHHMTDVELEGALARGKQILLARQRAQRRAGQVAPIWKDFSPYRVKTKGLDRQEMEITFKRLYQKLNAQTTTVSGYKKWLKRQSNIYKRRKSGQNFSKNELSKLWELYNKFKELHPTLVDKFGSDKIFSAITTRFVDTPRIDINKLDSALKDYVETQDDVEYTDEEWNSM